MPRFISIFSMIGLFSFLSCSRISATPPTSIIWWEKGMATRIEQKESLAACQQLWKALGKTKAEPLRMIVTEAYITRQKQEGKGLFFTWDRPVSHPIKGKRNAVQKVFVDMTACDEQAKKGTVWVFTANEKGYQTPAYAVSIDLQAIDFLSTL
ncbi:MAG: hypothetical protein AAFR59_01460 [Bacteroidota bacterium]